MICRALRNYLIDAQALTGHPAHPFEAVTVLDGRAIGNRNDARRYFRSIVGECIYAGRVPVSVPRTAQTAVTLHVVSQQYEAPLLGELPSVDSMVEVNVLTRGPDADYRAEIVGHLLRIATAGYVGNWDGIGICGVLIEQAGLEVTAPADGTDLWTFNWAMDMNVHHEVPAAVYPVETLTAKLSWATVDANTIALSALTSIVPTGRTLQTVTWAIHDTLSNPPLLTISGAPSDLASGAGVSGTNLEPQITGLTLPVVVVLTLADDAGAGSTLVETVG